MKIGAIPHKTILLALFGAVLGTLPSMAQLVPRPVQGDVLIGFREGQASYLINVGPASNFVNAPSGATPINVGNIAADLSTYNTTQIINEGEDDEEEVPVPWHQRPDFYWGAIGSYDSANATPPTQQNAIYISKLRSPVNVQSSPWPTLGSNPFNTVITNFTSIIHTGGYPTLVRTANSPVGAKQPATVATSQSYAKSGGGQGFGFFSGYESSFKNGADASAIDFYQITRNPSTVTYLGYFKITSTGALTFNKSAPSSTVDTDGDGFSDAIEALQGTDPNNAFDSFRIANVSHTTASGSGLQFQGAVGLTYTIQYSTTLQSDWVPVATLPVTTAGLQTWADPDAPRNSGPKGFYRIVVSLTTP
jgi:hypothetical protein